MGGALALSGFTLFWHRLLPPSPRPPSPEGKGEILAYLCKGLRPLQPRAAPGAARRSGGVPVPDGGAPALSGFTLLWHRLLPPSPRPALEERSSHSGEGGAFRFILPGASPLATPRCAGSGTAFRAVGGTGKRAGQRGNEGGRKFPATNTEFRKVLGVWGLLSEAPNAPYSSISAMSIKSLPSRWSSSWQKARARRSCPV